MVALHLEAVKNEKRRNYQHFTALCLGGIEKEERKEENSRLAILAGK